MQKTKSFEVLYPALHSGQDVVNREMDDFLLANGGYGVFWLCAHRGWRKTSLLLRRLKPYLQLGYPVGWYAPTMKPIQNAWYDMWIKAIGAENMEAWLNKSERILRIPGCGPINFVTLEQMSGGAGPTYPVVVGDEWGSIDDDVFAHIVEPIYEKGFRAYPRGEVILTGTPNRDGNPKNDFYYNLMDAKEGEAPGQMGWHIPLPAQMGPNGELIRFDSPYANPQYSYEWACSRYARSKQRMAWRVEWLCSFETSEGSQFPDAEKSLCIDYQERIAADGMGVEYLRQTPLSVLPEHQSFQTGVDVGIVEDFTVIAVFEKSSQEMVYFRRFLPETLSNFYIALKAVMRMYPGRTLVDVTGQGKLGDTHVENAMASQGYAIEGVRFDVATKPLLLDNLSSVLGRAQIKLFNLQIIGKELRSMQRKARPTGGVSIQGAKKSHDDIPMALAAMIKDVSLRILRPETEEPPAWFLQNPADWMEVSEYVGASQNW